ncbi:hypothetical protein BC830DRAFT_1104447 [Chytriomyces sp. MP71]|nr:hypothetical protein BC830DRAFT_1104447 [Chytriomyces sp. MP71]
MSFDTRAGAESAFDPSLAPLPIDATVSRREKSLAIVDTEARPRISYPFSDTEDSDTDLTSPLKSSPVTPPQSHGDAPPLPVSVGKKASNTSLQQHVQRKTSGINFRHHPYPASTDDDAYDSDDNITRDGKSFHQPGTSFGGSSVGSANGSAGAWGSLDAEKVLKSGYLKKKGEKRKTWKTRWFVLRTTKLAYYKNEKEYELLNIIPLQNVTTVADVDLQRRSNVFGVVTRERTFYLQANGPTDMESWIFLLRESQREVQKLTGGPPPPVRSRITSTSEGSPSIPSPPMAGGVLSSPLMNANRHESKVQFSDSIAVAVVGGGPIHVSLVKNIGSKTTSNSSLDGAPISLKRPTMTPTSGPIASPLAIEFTPLDSDAHSQISARESVDSSLLTYVSTPSMMPPSNGQSMSGSISGDFRKLALGAGADCSPGSASATAAASASAHTPSSLLALNAEPTNSTPESSPKSAAAAISRNHASARPTSGLAESPVSVLEASESSSRSPDSSSPASSPLGGVDGELADGAAVPAGATKLWRGWNGSLPSRTVGNAVGVWEGAAQSVDVLDVGGQGVSQLKSALRKPRLSAPHGPGMGAGDGSVADNEGVGSGDATGAGSSRKAKNAYVLSSSDEDEDGGMFGGHIGAVGRAESLGAGIVGVTDNTVVREGYLQKQGTKYNKAWKKRWFVLRNGKLMCYKDSAVESLWTHFMLLEN